MRKEQQSYILDLLIEKIPGLEINIIRDRQDTITSSAANALYNIWKDPKNKVSGRMYIKPPTLSSTELEYLQKEGLIRSVGDRIQITNKGSEIISVMVLGNNKSSFDKDSDKIDYFTAKSIVNIRQGSMKVENKKSEDKWWDRFFE